MPSDFVIDRESPLPLYRQIEGWLRSQIQAGAFSPGSILPSTKVLCKTLGGINHLTIRQAIAALVREGLLYSIQGKGTFVTEQKTRQSRIGLVLPNFDEEFTREIAQGVQEILDSEDQATGKSRASTVIFDSRHHSQKELDNIGQLQDLPIDGAIILPISYGDLTERLVRLKIDGFPLVLIDWVMPGIKFPAVYCDHYDGAYRITRHLLQEKRRRLAWMGTLQEPSGQKRYEGFRDALNDFGIACERKWIFELKMSTPTSPFEKVLEAAVDKIVSTYREIDAIVCSNDLQALACLKMLRQRGIDVPKKIAVVGFDDLTEAAHSLPPLTTVRQPIREMGRRAAELILQRINDPSRPIQEIILPVELVIRRSSARKTSTRSPNRK